MRKGIAENISKILSGKYSQKLLDHAKKSATDALKTSLKNVIQKTPEGTGDLVCNKIANRITSTEVRHRIIQKELQMNMIKNNLKKDIYL